MEPCNRSGELAVDELRVRPLLLLSTTTTTTTSTTTTTTATTTHLELSAALGTFFVFLTALLVFFFLWLYSRYCIQGQTAARTARGRRMLLQLQQQRQGFRHQQQSSPTGEPRPPGPALSTLLPAVAYSSVEGKAQECAICLSEYDVKDMVKVIPCCGHLFHQECIDRWLDSHDSCPVCRRTEILGSSDSAGRKDDDLSLQLGSTDTAEAQVTPPTNA